MPVLTLAQIACAPADGTSDGQFVIRAMATMLTVCALASLAIRSGRSGAGVVSLGLLLSSALLVSIGGGLTDLHFSFFLVIDLISLYQDWLWLVMAVVLVSVQHLVMAPGDLTLEIAESAMANLDMLTAQLAAWQAHGVRIALDHFGTGHSSLRHLSRLPVGALKLDQCFIAELNGEPEGSAVAEAVIRLGNSLQLDTVAVGIENLAQVTELTLLGCRAGQGFHFSYPLEAADLDALIHAGQCPVFPIRAVRGAGSLTP
jgi:hypothetical protein